MTKQNRLDELGYEKFDNLKDGLTASDTDDILNENGYDKCECCKSWEERYMTGGNSEGTICEDCYENSHKQIAVDARAIYRELGDGIDEPVKVKGV